MSFKLKIGHAIIDLDISEDYFLLKCVYLILAFICRTTQKPQDIVTKWYLYKIAMCRLIPKCWSQHWAYLFTQPNILAT